MMAYVFQMNRKMIRILSLILGSIFIIYLTSSRWQTHPIAMNEGGFQTKLVWSNGTLGITKKLQYRKK